MYRRLVSAGALAGLAVTAVLAANAPQVQLRGDRFKPLAYEEMTPEQRAMVEHILAGPRSSLNGPFNVLLRSPEWGDLAQTLGAHLRFKSSIPHKLNEFAILITGRFWNSQYEWFAHHKYALEAGLKEDIIADLAAGRRPAAMDADETIVYDFGHELLETRQVGDAHFQAAVDRFGERGVVDLVGVIAYYNLVSMALNVDRYPLPEGAKPELQALK